MKSLVLSLLSVVLFCSSLHAQVVTQPFFEDTYVFNTATNELISGNDEDILILENVTVTSPDQDLTIDFCVEWCTVLLVDGGSSTTPKLVVKTSSPQPVPGGAYDPFDPLDPTLPELDVTIKQEVFIPQDGTWVIDCLPPFPTPPICAAGVNLNDVWFGPGLITVPLPEDPANRVLSIFAEIDDVSFDPNETVVPRRYELASFGLTFKQHGRFLIVNVKQLSELESE